MHPITYRTLVVAALSALPAIALAQSTPPPLPAVVAPPTPAQPALTAEQLDELVAPVALYPDVLVSPILAAATYPLEVVEAHRWLTQPANAALAGDALTDAAAEQNWDSSVQALLPFPHILEMMDSHLDWTERLGEAFLAQPEDVMAAVQRLRHRAQAAGTLQLSTQQSVVNEGDDVAIAPATPQDVYVPEYNPWCAYGAWPYVPQGPYYFSPYQAYCNSGDDYLGYDAGIFLPYGYVPWGDFDWRHHHIHLYHDPFGRDPYGHDRYAHDAYGHSRYGQGRPAQVAGGDVWHHNPMHRDGAPYRDPRNASHFPTMRHMEMQHFAYAPAAGAPPSFVNTFHSPVVPTFHSPVVPSFHGAVGFRGGGQAPRFSAPVFAHAAPHFGGGGGRR